MTVRKTLIAVGTATLMSTSAWALPAPALSHPFGPPSATPNNTTNPGASHRSSAADDAIEDNASKGKHEDSGTKGNSGHSGKSHKCKPHGVGYVASGTLETWSLTNNPDGTYTGTVTVLVTHTNHHAAGDKTSPPTTKEYKVENVHVTLGLADTNNNGVGLDDLVKGDSVQLIGKITTLAKKCSHTGFEAKTTIRHIVFNAPPS